MGRCRQIIVDLKARRVAFHCGRSCHGKNAPAADERVSDAGFTLLGYLVEVTEEQLQERLDQGAVCWANEHVHCSTPALADVMVSTGVNQLASFMTRRRTVGDTDATLLPKEKPSKRCSSTPRTDWVGSIPVTTRATTVVIRDAHRKRCSLPRQRSGSLSPKCR